MSKAFFSEFGSFHFVGEDFVTVNFCFDVAVDELCEKSRDNGDDRVNFLLGDIAKLKSFDFLIGFVEEVDFGADVGNIFGDS